MVEDRDVFLFYELLRQQYNKHVGYEVVSKAITDMSPRFRKGLMMLLLGFLPDAVMAECGITVQQYGIVLVKHQYLCGQYHSLAYELLSVREHPEYFKHALASAAVTNNRERMAGTLAYFEALKKSGFRSELALPTRPGASPARGDDKPDPEPPPKQIPPPQESGSLEKIQALQFASKYTAEEIRNIAKYLDTKGVMVQTTFDELLNGSENKDEGTKNDKESGPDTGSTEKGPGDSEGTGE